MRCGIASAEGASAVVGVSTWKPQSAGTRPTQPSELPRAPRRTPSVIALLVGIALARAPVLREGEFWVKYQEFPYDKQEIRDARAHDKLLPDAVEAGFADVEVTKVNRTCSSLYCNVEA